MVILFVRVNSLLFIQCGNQTHAVDCLWYDCGIHLHNWLAQYSKETSRLVGLPYRCENLCSHTNADLLHRNK